MRRFFSFILVVLLTLGLTVGEAQAKRFGGGRSFGVQRSLNTSSFSRTQQSPFSAQKPSMAKSWLGPLAGLAMGGLLAYLFMGHGIGSGILSWLIIGSVLFLLWNLIRNRSRMSAQSAHYQSHFQNMSHGHETSSPFMGSSQPQAHQVVSYPVGFDVDSFLRDAKVQFIRLQAAYDKKNLNDLREFTTPEVFAEIQLQLHERGQQENQTEVIHLDAKLLDASTEFQVLVASVQFSGSIREDQQASASFSEIWHFRKDEAVQRWMVSGIQQTAGVH